MKQKANKGIELIVHQMEKKGLELGIISEPLTEKSKISLEASVLELKLIHEIQQIMYSENLDGLKNIPLSYQQLLPRINYAIKQMEEEIGKLDKKSDRLSKRDKAIFQRILNAFTKQNMAQANSLASELAETRKREKLIMHSRLALEQIVLRLYSVSELGDVVTTLTPASNVLHNVKTGMSEISPEIESEFSNIENLLNSIIMDAGHNSSMVIDFKTVGYNAKKILDETAIVTKKKVKEKFPDLPDHFPSFGIRNEEDEE